MTNCKTSLSYEYQKYQKPAIDRRRLWARQLLGDVCASCGTSDQLEFDHVDRTSKSFNIGSNLLKKKQDLIAELKKCQLLCRPCHAEKTKNESQALYSGPRPETEHGTLTMYAWHKCRCDPCMEANTEYHRQYRERKKWPQLEAAY